MFSMFDYIFFGLFAGFAVLELVHTRRPFPKMRAWRVRGVLMLAVYWVVVTYAPMLWDETLATYAVMNLSGLPIWVEAPLALLIVQLIAYAYHRGVHSNDALFRHLHQVHHSAERLDIWSTFHFHPLDAAMFALMGSLGLVFVMGASLEAVIFVALYGVFLDMFTHANIKTPRWLGYIITRPESHAAHHERGVHARNYATLPLVDMIFGTFYNPEHMDDAVGYYDGASERVGEMLIGRDVTTAIHTFDRAPAE